MFESEDAVLLVVASLVYRLLFDILSTKFVLITIMSEKINYIIDCVMRFVVNILNNCEKFEINIHQDSYGHERVVKNLVFCSLIFLRCIMWAKYSGDKFCC